MHYKLIDSYVLDEEVELQTDNPVKVKMEDVVQSLVGCPSLPNEPSSGLLYFEHQEGLSYVSCCTLSVTFRNVKHLSSSSELVQQHLLNVIFDSDGFHIIIVAFLENTTIGYSLESVCVCVCLCVCVCVFLQDNSKRNRSRNTKSEYIVVYENSSDEFDIELHRIKVKVTVGIKKFSPFTTIQIVRSYSSTLVQARNLILSIYLHLILIYKIYECHYA